VKELLPTPIVLFLALFLGIGLLVSVEERRRCALARQVYAEVIAGKWSRPLVLRSEPDAAKLHAWMSECETQEAICLRLAGTEPQLSDDHYRPQAEDCNFRRDVCAASYRP